ncbi:MAG: hypothetical protein IPM26_02030 [Saprospiraceae bacterium]|nr:hypothetical protein [Saprospiraceae bacterium]
MTSQPEFDKILNEKLIYTQGYDQYPEAVASLPGFRMVQRHPMDFGFSSFYL